MQRIRIATSLAGFRIPHLEGREHRQVGAMEVDAQAAEEQGRQPLLREAVAYLKIGQAKEAAVHLPLGGFLEVVGGTSYIQAGIERILPWVVYGPAVQGFYKEVATVAAFLERNETFSLKEIRNAGLPTEKDAHVEAFPHKLGAETINKLRNVGVTDSHLVIAVHNTVTIHIEVLHITRTHAAELLLRTPGYLGFVVEIPQGNKSELLVVTLAHTILVFVLVIGLILVDYSIVRKSAIGIQAHTEISERLVILNGTVDTLVFHFTQIGKRHIVDACDAGQ